MADPVVPDQKTQELFDLLGLSEPSQRDEFVRMASCTTVALSPEVPVHFQLDSLTLIVEEDANA